MFFCENHKNNFVFVLRVKVLKRVILGLVGLPFKNLDTATSAKFQISSQISSHEMKSNFQTKKIKLEFY